ncbi:MAG TPA: PDZ domain-containing protein, partial [Acidobacteriota bacterium]|nr:PDZ domain-containing protein [Acidobacteriota bacterium]
LILTTALISPRDEKIAVITGDGRKIEAEFLGFDSETHLALVRAKDKGLPPLAMSEAGEVAPGAWISVVSVSPEMTPAVTQGIVSSVSEERLRLNIWVTPGSSGGPVIDENGLMVGLLRGIYTEDRPVLFEFRDKEQVGSGYAFSQAEAPSSGMAVAIPVDVVKKIAFEIRDKGKVQRGWIGLSIGQNEDDRIEVVGVDDASPAELAKLKEGDLILALDGKEIATASMLASEIRKRRPGEDVTVRIERDGKPMDVKIKLGEYPENEARREMDLKFPGLFPPGAPRPFAVTPKGAAPKPPKAPIGPKGREFSWERRKYIGVYLDELNKEMSAFFGLKDGTGLLVNRLTPKGPAEKAGLKIGDVIVKAEGRRVETVNELSGAVQDKKKGDKIKLEVLRDKKPHSIDVEVEEEERGGVVSWALPGNSRERLLAYGESARAYADKLGEVFTREANGDMSKLDAELSLMAGKARSAARNLRSAFTRAVRKI